MKSFFTFFARSLAIGLVAFLSLTTLRAQNRVNFEVDDFAFTIPAKWQWEEPAFSMRKAQLKVTDDASKISVEVVFFEFGPGGAGGVQANVDRWFRQFSEPLEKLNSKVEKVTVGKYKITYVQAEGTYNSGMPGGSLTKMADYALMGAIIESDNGDVFVRMTGPKTLVKSSIADFKTLVESGPKKKS